MKEVKVRISKREDMKFVIKLIKEFEAEFENRPDRLEINAEILERDGFYLQSLLFVCHVAEDSLSDEIVGYALFCNTYSTWLGKVFFLEDLYVKPAYRNRGIGKEIFLTVAKKAYMCKSRVDFQVLSWNPAMKFCKKLGATNLTETEKWNSVRLNLNALKNIFEK